MSVAWLECAGSDRNFLLVANSDFVTGSRKAKNLLMEYRMAKPPFGKHAFYQFPTYPYDRRRRDDNRRHSRRNRHTLAPRGMPACAIATSRFSVAHLTSGLMTHLFWQMRINFRGIREPAVSSARYIHNASGYRWRSALVRV